MDPNDENTLRFALLIAGAGIAALACQFMFKLGQLVYQELYICGGLC